MGAAGEEYWRDMRRMYPHLDMQPDKQSAPGRTRFGRARLRQVRGVWWVRQKGKWERA